MQINRGKNDARSATVGENQEGKRMLGPRERDKPIIHLFFLVERVSYVHPGMLCAHFNAILIRQWWTKFHHVQINSQNAF